MRPQAYFDHVLERERALDGADGGGGAYAVHVQVHLQQLVLAATVCGGFTHQLPAARLQQRVLQLADLSLQLATVFVVVFVFVFLVIVIVFFVFVFVFVV